MYSILHETDNATTVNLSTFGKLLPGKSKQLVTVCAKTLKVYRFNPYISHPDHSAEPNKILNPTKHDTNLECLLHFTFMAPPRSIKTARIPCMSYYLLKLTCLIYKPISD
jgi:hypothetical protein